MNETYRVIRTSQGLVVHFENGDKVPGFMALSLGRELMDQYGEKSYIYFARHPMQQGIYKIGVSIDPLRREREFGGEIVHVIPCAPSRVYRIERAIHDAFDCTGSRVNGEWFRLAENGRDAVKERISKVHDEFKLVMWLRGLKDNYGLELDI